MADTNAKSPFSRLDTSLMRATKPQEPRNVGTQERGNPLTQLPRNQGTQDDAKVVSQETRNPGRQEVGKRANYPQQTFNIHPDVIDMLDEAKRVLRRQYNIKTSKEIITEEAIRHFCLEFQQKKDASTLVQTLKKTPGTQERGNPGTK